MIERHRPARVTRQADGAFSLAVEGGEVIRAVPEPGGWRVEGGADAPAAWSLRRADGAAGGFLLTAAGGRDEYAARTSGLGGPGRGARYLLMEDGRLFRLALSDPRAPRYELEGWEAPGAYLVVRPEGEGWRIEPCAASAGLEDVRALSILTAAEILDAEEPLAGGDAP